VRARTWLAKAKLKPKKLVFYALNGIEGVHVADVLAYDLSQLGIELEAKYFSSTELFRRAGTRGEPFDIVMVGWAADYADPVTFFRPLLHGESLRASGNGNLSYLDDPKVNAAIDAADRLTGTARRKAWADLDARLMRENPPWAPYFHTTSRTFVSADLGCFFVHPVYGLDIAAVCKK
jgi:peptide/nickel transport system substrate-binding protein